MCGGLRHFGLYGDEEGTAGLGIKGFFEEQTTGGTVETLGSRLALTTTDV